MIPQNQCKPTTMGALKNEVIDAELENTGMLYGLLIDNTYSDKPLAAVREPIQNANDAHIEAGIHDRPLEIHLPTILTPEFVVRDFGNGMNKDMMRKAMTLGYTTKNKTNKVVGGKGVGFMAVFAYSSGFTVETVHDKTKFVYRMFRKEKDGKPAYVQIGDSTPSNEESGTSVRVAVRADDFSRFSTALHSTCDRYVIKPIVTGDPGFEFVNRKVIVSGDNWTIYESIRRKHSYRYNPYSPKAIMGNMQYPINVDTLRNSGFTSYELAILEADIDFVFDIGELETSTSREALSYNDETIGKLKERIIYVKSELIQQVNVQIQSCKSAWDAQGKLNDILESMAHMDKIKASEFSYMGKPLPTRFIIDVNLINKTYDVGLKAFLVNTHSAFSGMRKHMYAAPTIMNGGKTTGLYPKYKQNELVIVSDKQIRLPSRLKHWRDEIVTDNALNICVLVFSKFDDTALIAKAIKMLIEQVGGAPYIDMKTIPDLSVNVSHGLSKSSVSKVVKYNFKNSWRIAGRKVCWDKAIINVDTDIGVYVDLRDWEPKKFLTTDNMSKCIDTAFHLGILKDKTVYGVPGTYKNKMKEHKNWSDLYSHIQKQCHKRLAKLRPVVSDICMVTSLHKFDTNHQNILTSMNKQRKKLNPKSHIHKLVVDMFDTPITSLEDAQKLMYLCNAVGVVSKNYDTIEDELCRLSIYTEQLKLEKDIYKSYGLLRLMKIGGEVGVYAMHELLAYINSKKDI